MAMTGDDSRRSEIKARIRGAVIACAVGQAAIGAMLLYGLYAQEPGVSKIAAFLLIAWWPVGFLMTYGELDEQYGGDTAVWPYVGVAAVMAFLGFLGWYL